MIKKTIWLQVGVGIWATGFFESGSLKAGQPTEPPSGAPVIADNRDDVAASLRRFSIPAGYAQDSLRAFATQSGVQLLYSSTDLSRVSTPAVAGEFTPADALSRLLADTGLSAVERDDGRVFAIKPPPKPVDPARAHNDDDSQQTVVLEPVVVTGSRIRNARDEASVVPLLTLDRQDLERAGVTNAGDLPRLIPQAYGVESYKGRGMGGQATGLYPVVDGTAITADRTTRVAFDLRALGGANTLVLINGRRFAANGQSASQDRFDLAALPVAMIERVEVLTDGASAIYGSDAFSGIVNVITRKDYEGTEVTLSYGNTFSTDTAERNASFVHGQRVGPLSVTVSGAWMDRNALAARDRPFVATSDWVSLGGTYPAGTIIPFGVVSGAGAVRSVTGAPLAGVGSPYAQIPDGATGGPLTAADFIPGAPAFTGHEPYANILSPQESTSGAVDLSYQLTPTLELFGSAMKRSTETQFEGFPVTFRNLLLIPAFYPGNPFGQDIFLQKTFWELGNIAGGKDSTNEHTQAVVGVRVELPREWQAEVAFEWSSNLLLDENGYLDGLRDPAAFYAALASGQLALFYDSRTSQPNSVALLRSFLRKSDLKEENKLTTWSTQADGPLWELPAGRVRMAVGAEHRSEDLHVSQTEITAGRFPENLERDVAAGFVELRVPVIGAAQHVPLVNRFEVSGALREDHYSDFGGNLSPRYGAQWKPVSEVLFRASQSHSFRAPSLHNLNLPTQNVPTNALGEFVTVDRARNNELVGPIIGTFGGNPDLDAEKSVSNSVGMVIEPTAKTLRGFSFSVDFTATRFTGRINETYNPQDIADYFPNRVTRGAPLPGDPPGTPGPIIGMDFRKENLLSTDLVTVDYQIAYRRQFDAGRLETRFNISDYLSYEQRVAKNAPTSDETHLAPLRFLWQTNWSQGAWDFGVGGTYQEAIYTDSSERHKDIRSSIEWNVQVAYDFGLSSLGGGAGQGENRGWWWRALNDTRVSLTVFNVFNREPPGSDGSAGFAVTDPRMARYVVSVTKRF